MAWRAAGRLLERDGEPTYLLGDTAWEALRRLTADEADLYLETRAAQGFNAVFTVALPEYEPLDEPGAVGATPFHDLDPVRPDERYWRHVDRFVEKAASLGLTVGLNPAWGNHWADEPLLFDAGSAERYARWIAERYADADLIWMIGGDREVTTPAHRAVVEAFAAGVAGRQPVAFHPRGHGSSADVFPDAPWLDIHMVQSGHTGWGTPNYQLIEQDLRWERPVVDGEPNYENHPVMTPPRHPGGIWERAGDWRFDDADVRRAAYHATFAGAAGHVYGCHDIWQFNDEAQRRPMNASNLPWQEALQLPGAVQMGHLARLLREVRFAEWAPDQSVISTGAGFLAGHQRAMVRTGPPGVLVYVPPGRAPQLDLNRWGERDWSTRWWHPIDGTWHQERPAGDGVLLLA